MREPIVQEIDDMASCIVWPAARVLLHWLCTWGPTILGLYQGALILGSSQMAVIASGCARAQAETDQKNAKSRKVEK